MIVGTASCMMSGIDVSERIALMHVCVYLGLRDAFKRNIYIATFSNCSSLNCVVYIATRPEMRISLHDSCQESTKEDQLLGYIHVFLLSTVLKLPLVSHSKSSGCERQDNRK
jgi:hypothetical protein